MGVPRGVPRKALGSPVKGILGAMYEGCIRLEGLFL